MRDYADDGRRLLAERKQLMTRSQRRDLTDWFDSMDSFAQEWEASGERAALPTG